MAEAGGRLWISQAESDRWAAERLFDPAHPRSYCQTIAKCQQTVEKSVKAVAAAMRDRFPITVAIGYGHEVDRLASALRRRRPARAGDPGDIQSRVNRLLNDHAIVEIKALESLIPRRPPPGQLHARNTEYPFERIAGDWTAPASGAFTEAEVQRFRQLADRIHAGSGRIVSILRR